MPKQSEFKKFESIAMSRTNNVKESCQGCEDLQRYIDEKFSELSGLMISHNQTIIEALATQKVNIRSLVRQEQIIGDLKGDFPIKSLAELTKINTKIDENSRPKYVKAVKALLRGKLAKTLTEVFSMEVICLINVDGTHGKARLKDFPNVYETVIEALQELETADPKKELRVAIQVIKKRHFHNVCIQKKCETAQPSLSDTQPTE